MALELLLPLNLLYISPYLNSRIQDFKISVREFLRKFDLKAYSESGLIAYRAIKGTNEQQKLKHFTLGVRNSVKTLLVLLGFSLKCHSEIHFITSQKFFNVTYSSAQTSCTDSLLFMKCKFNKFLRSLTEIQVKMLVSCFLF